MDGSKRLLLIAADAVDAAAVRAALAPQGPGQALAQEVTLVTSLAAAIEALREPGFAAILLDIVPSLGRPAKAVRLLLESAADTPLLVIADSHSVPAAIDAVHQGAQDYILRSSLGGDALEHRLRFCIERFRQARETQKLASRFESLIRDNADAILVLDLAGHIKFANLASGKLFNQDPADLIGNHPGIPVDAEETMEIVIGPPGGADAVVDVRMMQTFWDAEPVFLATLRDISLRKRAERALVQAKQQAELASEMKSRFLANMSHELRTPLNCIIGFTEMMQKGLFGEIGNQRYADYIDTIRHSGEHLLTLINNLLDLSKIEAGHEEVDEDIVDILELLRATAQAEEPTAREHGIVLACKVEQHPRLVRADRVKLEQIFLNLLSNAIKFTPEGGKVTLHGKMAASGDYEITVVDTGCGMDQKEIPQAMGSFAQIRNPYTRKQDRGTGLGLPIARSLVELHDGSLKITSRRGFGTRATVLLPAARVVDKQLGSVMERASISRGHRPS